MSDKRDSADVVISTHNDPTFTTEGPGRPIGTLRVDEAGNAGRTIAQPQAGRAYNQGEGNFVSSGPMTNEFAGGIPLADLSARLVLGEVGPSPSSSEDKITGMSFNQTHGRDFALVTGTGTKLDGVQLNQGAGNDVLTIQQESQASIRNTNFNGGPGNDLLILRDATFVPEDTETPKGTTVLFDKLNVTKLDDGKFRITYQFQSNGTPTDPASPVNSFTFEGYEKIAYGGQVYTPDQLFELSSRDAVPVNRSPTASGFVPHERK